MAKKLQAGSLDRTIELRHRDSLQGPQRDEAGQIITRDNEPYARVKAQKEDQAASEKTLLNRPTAVGESVFTIRFRDDVRPTDELFCEAVTYRVTEVAEGEGRHQWTRITCLKHD